MGVCLVMVLATYWKKLQLFSQPFPIQTNKTPRNFLATCCYYLNATAAAIPDKAQTLIKATGKAVFKIHMELLHSKSYSLYRLHSHSKIMETVHRNLNSKGVKKCRNKELFLYPELLPNAAGLSDLHKKKGCTFMNPTPTQGLNLQKWSLQPYSGTIRLSYIQLQEGLDIHALCKQVEEKTSNSQNVFPVTKKCFENWLGISNDL